MPYLPSLALFFLAAGMAWLLGSMLHLQGTAFVVGRGLLLLLGAIAAIVIWRFRHDLFPSTPAKGSADSGSSSSDTENVDALTHLLRDAQAGLSTSQRATMRSLESAPLLYILGPANSAKTTAVLRSGLEPELLAGQVHRDLGVVPTALANLWYTEQGIVLEAGDALRERDGLWNTLLRRTRPRLFRSAFGARVPPRAAVVCASCESFFGPDAANSLRTLAVSTNRMLRSIAHQIGTDIPVFVLFTKLDRVAGFSEFVGRLTTSEITPPLGVSLPRERPATGLYAEQATSSLASALDRLFFSISEFRVESLAREISSDAGVSIYEFPRELAKLRNNMTSFLVELTRPTHLSANPFLRGFYFTGVRSYLAEHSVSSPAAMPAGQEFQLAAGATRVLSRRSLQAEAEAGSSRAVAGSVTQKVAQWCFLPHLFPEVVFGDRAVLSPPDGSRRFTLVRRSALATVCAALVLWLVGASVSYSNNLRIEHDIRDLAAAIPATSPLTTLAPADQLKNLDQLRSHLLALEESEANGAPLRLRWGLYRGNDLIGPAHRLYFDRFQRLLLSRTQGKLITTLSTLPAAAPPEADYLAAYNPLRGYLITTSFPDKSAAEFLVPVLLHAWLSDEKPSSDMQPQLAERQFSFYADELRRGNPYQTAPVMLAVTRARLYLNSFGSLDRIYQNILTAANRAAPSVDFNHLFPGSATTVVAPHIVPGAFTREGFAYVQTALLHPDLYFAGESWVLGNQTPPSVQVADLTAKLSSRYTADFSTQWRDFLHTAAVVRYRSLADARSRLQSLSSPNSALLALMFTVSSNTAVANPAIAQQFQPTQSLVPPNSTNRFISSGNTTYINGLLGLEGALSAFIQDPSSANNPSATQPIISAAVTAHSAVGQTSQNFSVDPSAHIEQTVITLLREPIASVEDAVRGERPQQLNIAGRAFCSTLSTLITKYPFSRSSSIEATPAEVAAVLKPATGSLWQFYESTLKAILLQQGSSYVVAPGATLPPTPAFVQFFNHLAALSANLFPNNAATPTFTFNAHVLRSKEIQSVTLAVDSQHLTGADVGRDFTWSAQSAQSAELLANYGSGSLPLHFDGTWSLFHLLDRGKLEQSGIPARFAYPLEISNTPVVINGTPLTERIEISGPGASILVPGALGGLHCPAQIAR